MPKSTDTSPVIAAWVDTENPTGIGVLDRLLSRMAALTPEQRNERLNGGVRHYLPYVLIVLVPFLALLLKVLSWKRGMLYGEHPVVALNAQTVAFVFATVSALPLGETIGSLLIAVLVVHGALAMRKVYGGRWVPNVLREGLLMLIYSMVLGLALAALATLSLAI